MVLHTGSLSLGAKATKKPAGASMGRIPMESGFGGGGGGNHKRSFSQFVEDLSEASEAEEEDDSVFGDEAMEDDGEGGGRRGGRGRRDTDGIDINDPTLKKTRVDDVLDLLDEQAQKPEEEGVTTNIHEISKMIDSDDEMDSAIPATNRERALDSDDDDSTSGDEEDGRATGNNQGDRASDDGPSAVDIIHRKKERRKKRLARAARERRFRQGSSIKDFIRSSAIRDDIEQDDEDDEEDDEDDGNREKGKGAAAATSGGQLPTAIVSDVHNLNATGGNRAERTNRDLAKMTRTQREVFAGAMFSSIGEGMDDFGKNAGFMLNRKTANTNGRWRQTLMENYATTGLRPLASTIATARVMSDVAEKRKIPLANVEMTEDRKNRAKFMEDAVINYCTQQTVDPDMLCTNMLRDLNKDCRLFQDSKTYVREGSNQVLINDSAMRGYRESAKLMKSIMQFQLTYNMRKAASAAAASGRG